MAAVRLPRRPHRPSPTLCALSQPTEPARAMIEVLTQAGHQIGRCLSQPTGPDGSNARRKRNRKAPALAAGPFRDLSSIRQLLSSRTIRSQLTRL